MFDEEKMIFDVVLYAKQIQSYLAQRKYVGYSEYRFRVLCNGICRGLALWTEDTYIGDEKRTEIRDAFQSFFCALHEMVTFLQNSQNSMEQIERQLVESLIYQGVIYRYLGYGDGDPTTPHPIIEPRFEDIYVSWSKNERNAYIEQKLYYPYTMLKAEIKSPEFGFDIKDFEAFFEDTFRESVYLARGTEQEVVYPTIEETIIDKRIEYDTEE